MGELDQTRALQPRQRNQHAADDDDLYKTLEQIDDRLEVHVVAGDLHHFLFEIDQAADADRTNGRVFRAQTVEMSLLDARQDDGSYTGQRALVGRREI